MSCGDTHGVDCSEVLDDVYEYLNGELDGGRLARIRLHLDECSGCLQEYGLEKVVRELVQRSCHCTAPAGLRAAIIERITSIRVQGR